MMLDSDDTVNSLHEKLSKKAAVELHGEPVREGCVKYEWNNTVWNLDDGA